MTAYNITPVTGIKSVDFRIKASGSGVVNWNGTTTVRGNDGMEVNNHTMPKLRGYTNLTGNVSEKGYQFKKEARDIDFKKTPMYVSANCLRFHLFKEHAFDNHFATRLNQEELLASNIGLLRGYATASTGAMRTSPLLFTDLVDIKGNGNYEQFSRAGSKEGDAGSTTIFSKTTFGDTEYIGYGSINIEDLSFIVLDDKFGRASVSKLKDDRVEPLRQAIEEQIKSLAPKGYEFTAPLAVFHDNYVRRGALFQEGEAGILLSQEAIDVLVSYTIETLKALSIVQGKGYLNVDDVLVDYNDSSSIMRIRADESAIESMPEAPYAVYFNAVDIESN